jgi:hypothetical protein
MLSDRLGELDRALVTVFMALRPHVPSDPGIMQAGWLPGVSCIQGRFSSQIVGFASLGSAHT